MIPDETPILIAGAGPTGLALAIMLQQSGIAHVLIERTTERSALSRAAVVHAHTLEALDQLGVVDELRQQGLLLDRFTFRDRGRELTRVEFADLPSRFPHLLMIPQNITEEILENRLLALGGTIWRGAELSDVTQDDLGALAVIRSAGAVHQLRARFVIGADGMRSRVRDAAAIGFDGSTLAQGFALADVDIDWPEQRSEVSLYLSGAGMLVVAPLPNGQFRLVAAVEDAPTIPPLDYMQAILDTRGPSGRRAIISHLAWSSAFHIHHRLARQYRSGRLFLMGDAAHVHSPAGGQGMNTGLVDAVMLGRLVVRVIGEGAPEAILNQYEHFRRPAAAEVMALVGRLTRIATARSAVARTIRNILLRTVGRTSRVRTAMALNLSGVARRRYAPDLIPARPHVAPHRPKIILEALYD
ncbi:MAG: FAD-dependent monooxygenase [Sphingopyxis sp.]|nr:FAD-dependent monooxygenase [Sphingopyxis sp.]